LIEKNDKKMVREILNRIFVRELVLDIETLIPPSRQKVGVFWTSRKGKYRWILKDGISYEPIAEGEGWGIEETKTKAKEVARKIGGKIIGGWHY